MRRFFVGGYVLLLGLISGAAYAGPPLPKGKMAAYAFTGLYPTRGDGAEAAKYGYVDANGRWVIQPQFDEADEFLSGVARVRIGQHWGAVNVAGRRLLPIQYPMVQVHRDGYLVVPAEMEKGQWRKVGLFGRRGNPVFPQQYDQVRSLGGGVWALKSNEMYQLGIAYLAEVKKVRYYAVKGSASGWVLAQEAKHRTGDQWAFITKNGQRKASFASKRVTAFNGFCAIANQGKVAGVVLNRQAKAASYHTAVRQLGTPQHVGKSMFAFFAARAVNGKYGFMNRECQWITKPMFERLGNMSEGLIAARSNGKWGFVRPNKSPWVVPPRFAGATSAQWTAFGPRAFIKRKGHWQMVGRKGRWVGSQKLADRVDFPQGASAGVATYGVGRGKQRKELKGFLRADGTWLVFPKYDSATGFRHGYATAALNGSHWLLGKDGQVVKCLEGKCRDAQAAPISLEHVR